MSGQPCLYILPNEILVVVLASFPTRVLLPLATVSRRFHAIVLRIIHFRLLLAAASPDYKVILEAYHPSRKNVYGYLFCRYLQTDGLSSKHEGEGSLYEDCAGAEGRFAKLGALYSRFRPEHAGIEGSMPLRRIAGATPAGSDGMQPIYTNDGDGGGKKVTHNLRLDADELFGQFCAYANLVQLGPRRGVFLSTVPIVPSGEGVMRVWRTWLQDRSRDAIRSMDLPLTPETSPSSSLPNISGDRTIMWTDYRRNVGLRVGIEEIPSTSRTQTSDEDGPMNVTMEIKELVIRTTHLMLAVEASVHDRHNRSGKTLIFGNFAVAAS